MEYEAVIGLEVHIQLKTKSKMFTRAPYKYGCEPNTLTDPLVLGLPGSLPVMNREAIGKSIQVGLLFGCKIAEICKWDRKHYFYPDLPKGYQLSQYDQPICIGGEVEIELPGPSRNVMGNHRKIRLTRIHLEEDVGKLTHFGHGSLVDYNRAGVPLIEIVSEPDMRSADEAFAYLNALRMNIVYAGLSDCDMEKGQLRCDANVSIRLKGDAKLGTKVEIKNMNSASGVRNAIQYEIKRQIQAKESGEPIIQETRRWNPEKSITSSMRSKECAQDYCYFTCPDLMPVQIPGEKVRDLQKELPELPFDKQRRFMSDYDLPFTLTSVICPEKPIADFFEETLVAGEFWSESAIKSDIAKMVANFVANDLLRELASFQSESFKDGESENNCESIEDDRDINPLAHKAGARSMGSILNQAPLKPVHLAGLIKLILEGAISKQIAQDVFVEMFKTGKMPGVIVDEKGLRQTSDTEELEAICADIIAKNPKPVEEFKSGKENAINALKGQVMKATRGQANPQVVDAVLRKLLVA